MKAPHEIHVNENGECVECGRKLPAEKKDAPTKPKRERIVLTVPHGEEGVLENMLIDLVDRYKELWPDQISDVGEDHWRYKSVHFAVYGALTLEIVPAEEGG